MKILQIREVDKKRSEVLTDEALRFLLYHSEIRHFGLEEGMEIPEEIAQEILTKLLPKRAKLRAMNLLQARDYTEARLREKLHDGGYPESVIDEAIAYVSSYRYIDDERYARDFIRGRMTRASRTKIRMELRQRGIDAGIIDAAMEELYEDKLLAGEDPEISQIRRQLEKRHFDGALAGYEEKQKFLASMARKGFSPDKVRQVMDQGE